MADIEDDDELFANFKNWLKLFGFQPPQHLKLVQFQDTGRGLVTTRDISAGELLVSLPEDLLITTGTVLSSRIGTCAKNFEPRLSALQALCAFLMTERCCGESSKWQPYLMLLPGFYSTSFFCPGRLIQFFPTTVQERIKERNVKLTREYTTLRPFLKHLQCSLSLPEGFLTFALFRWAWASVNTRCVYMQRHQSAGLWSANDHCALAPFLDFLNHSCEARVEAGFNAETKTYDVRTLREIRKDQQVFISYGFHDNVTLLLEYGFVVPRNPHSVVAFCPEDVLGAIEAALGRCVLNEARTKLHRLNANGMMRDLSATWDGPSWCLTTAIDLLLEGREQGSGERVLQCLFKKRLNCCLQLQDKSNIPGQLNSVFLSMASALIDEELCILRDCCQP